MATTVSTIVFYISAFVLIGAATMVIIARNPVRAILFLVLTFVASAVLWMLLQAEFLSLVLIFVYVGAVMTLFLFVVMMLNIDLSTLKEKFVRYLPVGLIIMACLLGVMLLVISPQHYSSANQHLPILSAQYNNTEALGVLLFTHYLYPFELAGVLLLVAIIAAVVLAFHGKKTNTKTQLMSEQQAVQKSQRLKIIKMHSNTHSSS